jgi:hypothetical protein
MYGNPDLKHCRSGLRRANGNPAAGNTNIYSAGKLLGYRVKPDNDRGWDVIPGLIGNPVRLCHSRESGNPDLKHCRSGLRRANGNPDFRNTNIWSAGKFLVYRVKPDNDRGWYVIPAKAGIQITE